MVNVEDRVETAQRYFKEGYNCCQAVALAFSDVAGGDKELLATISAPMGGGMGQLREVCGAVSGMFLVSSFLINASDPQNTIARKQSYEAVRALAKEFTDKNGSIVCRELLGLTTEKHTEQKQKKRPCTEYVADSARFVAEMINQRVDL